MKPLRFFEKKSENLSNILVFFGFCGSVKALLTIIATDFLIFYKFAIKASV